MDDEQLAVDEKSLRTIREDPEDEGASQRNASLPTSVPMSNTYSVDRDTTAEHHSEDKQVQTDDVAQTTDAPPLTDEQVKGNGKIQGSGNDGNDLTFGQRAPPSSRQPSAVSRYHTEHSISEEVPDKHELSKVNFADVCSKLEMLELESDEIVDGDKDDGADDYEELRGALSMQEGDGAELAVYKDQRDGQVSFGLAGKDGQSQIFLSSDSNMESDSVSLMGDLGPPTILQYRRESREVVKRFRDPTPVADRYVPKWDPLTGKYTLPESLWKAGLQCDLCGEELMAPSWIDPEYKAMVQNTPVSIYMMKHIPPVERLVQVGSYCCDQYKEYCEMLFQYWADHGDFLSSGLVGLIDIGPSIHQKSKNIRKMAKNRFLQKMRRRDDDMMQQITPVNPFSSFGNRQVKTISFSMASRKCREAGWIVDVDQEKAKIRRQALAEDDRFENGSKVSVVSGTSTSSVHFPKLPSHRHSVTLSKAAPLEEQTSTVLKSPVKLPGVQLPWQSSLAELATDGKTQERCPVVKMKSPRLSSNMPDIQPVMVHYDQSLQSTAVERGLSPRSPRDSGNRTMHGSFSYFQPSKSNTTSLTSQSKNKDLPQKVAEHNQQAGAFQLPDMLPLPSTILQASADMNKLPLPLLSQLLQGQLSKDYMQNPDVRTYNDGAVFYMKLPDGTATAFYPSGQIAVSMTGMQDGQQMLFAYEEEANNKESWLVAAFDSSLPHGCCYFGGGNVRVLLTEQGGWLFDEDGTQLKLWSWLGHYPHVHAPPFQPIHVPKLTDHLSFRCVRHDQITVTFTYGPRTARFPIKLHLPDVQLARKAVLSLGVDNELREKKACIRSVLTTVSRILQCPQYGANLTKKQQARMPLAEESEVPTTNSSSVLSAEQKLSAQGNHDLSTGTSTIVVAKLKKMKAVKLSGASSYSLARTS